MRIFWTAPKWEKVERIVCSVHVWEMPATNTRLDGAAVLHDDDGDDSDSTKWWHPIDRIIAMNKFIVADRAESAIIIADYCPFTVHQRSCVKKGIKEILLLLILSNGRRLPGRSAGYGLNPLQYNIMITATTCTTTSSHHMVPQDSRHIIMRHFKSERKK